MSHMGEQKIKFKYVFDKAYNPKYVTGAFGGPTPKEEIIINFFMERQPIPYSETMTVNSDGTIGDLVEMEPMGVPDLLNVLRFVETGIVMDLQTAKDIHSWLGDNIEMLESIRKG